MTLPHCSTCRYWIPQATSLNKIGQCRLNPPAVLLVNGMLTGAIVHTKHDEFCSHHEAKVDIVSQPVTLTKLPRGSL